MVSVSARIEEYLDTPSRAGLLELALFLENEFAVLLTDEDIDRLREATVEELSSFLEAVLHGESE